MRIVIFGTGGIGGNFGGYLARAGADVTFIARGEHLRAIRENGLQVEAPKGNFTIKPAQTTDDISKAGKCDVVFICTKAWQLETAAQTIKPLLAGDTFVLPLQNSIEAADFLAEHLGRERVLGGICYTQSYIVGPGVIHGNGGSIVYGELDNKPSERTAALEKLIKQAEGISCENTTNIQLKMWKKFAWISSASAIGAATRAPRGVWHKMPETQNLFDTLLAEAFAVARAQGVAMGEVERKEIMDFLDGTLPGFTTSMQRDMLAGTRSELEYQIGAVVRLGEKYKVPTPISATIFAALLPQELRAQGKAEFKI